MFIFYLEKGRWFDKVVGGWEGKRLVIVVWNCESIGCFFKGGNE